MTSRKIKQDEKEDQRYYKIRYKCDKLYYENTET